MDAYNEGVHEWLATPPVCPVRTKCGPKLAKHFRHVTPGMIVALVPLVSSLVGAGLTTGVCQISKLEQALRVQLGSNVVLRGGELDLEKLVYDVANHIQQVFAVFRYIKQEEISQTPDQYRRFPRPVASGTRWLLQIGRWSALFWRSWTSSQGSPTVYIQTNEGSVQHLVLTAFCISLCVPKFKQQSTYENAGFTEQVAKS